MEKKINIAELLKDCPKGMELDCLMFDNVTLLRVDDREDVIFPIILLREDGNSVILTKYGQCTNANSAKCVIFPKGKTTWDGFQRPFKDGDVVASNSGSWIGITNGGKSDWFMPTYCVIKSDNEFEAYFDEKERWAFNRLATEKEKQKLFDAIKANGYKWNAETKTLEKFVVPKFKVGDRIKNNNTVLTIITVGKNSYIVEDNPDNFGILMFSQQDKWELNNGHKFKVGDRIKQKGSPRSYIISSIEYDRYRLNNNQFIRFTDEHIYELVPNKFDITTLKPFDKVLVRCNTLEKWRIQLFEKYNETCKYPFICMGYNKYKQCIPYEGNEYLFDTTDDCDEYYKTWE